MFALFGLSRAHKAGELSKTSREGGIIVAKTLKRIKRELVSDGAKRKALKQLGYLDRVKDRGWNSLTSKECGRVGGLVSREKKKKTAVH